jgi:hyperosmotically inducible protein
MKTDMKLKQDVEDELDWTPDVESAHIGVEVCDGVVTLSGHPASFSEKLAAAAAARRVLGVRAVVIDMEVRLPNAEVRDDGEIVHAAQSVLHWTVGLRADAVTLQVEKGKVTLRGEVDSAFQRDMASRHIAHMRGVIAVDNLIRVRPGFAVGDIGEKIARALVRHAEREAHHIAVDVSGGTVTLSGTVGTCAERDAARGAAWSTRGVHAVIDNLEVEAR